MARRTFESPMDFQWQSGHGPTPLDSPFTKYSANSKESCHGLAGQKRDFDYFDSPQKPPSPSLRNLESQPPFAPTTPSMKPPEQFRNPAFTTPQRTIDTDFSSGPENQSSPLADNEDTPEQPARSGAVDTNSALIMFQGNKPGKPLPPKSIFGPYTPARGGIPRRHATSVITRRESKRRRRDVEGRGVRLVRRRPSDESDCEDHDRPSGSAPPKATTPPREIGLLPSILTFVDAHPDLPDVLSRYAQFLLNLFFVGLLIFIVYCFFATIRSDVDEASREVAAETMAEMVACTREFKSNKCDSAERVPAMERFWGISNVSLTVFRHKRQHEEATFHSSNGHPQQNSFQPGGSYAYLRNPDHTPLMGRGIMGRGPNGVAMPSPRKKFEE